jgi:hypothetical protein
MNTLRYSCFFFLILFFPLWAQGQKTRIEGRVFDAKTGEGIPFVTLQLKGTGYFNETDPDGQFTIETDRQDATVLTVSYIGYEEQDVPIQVGQVNQLKIALTAVEQTLKVIEVFAEGRPRKDTAAIALYRRVVAAKPKNNLEATLQRYTLENYVKTQFDLYNVDIEELRNKKLLRNFDFVFENADTLADGTVVLPALLRETLSEVYFTREPNRRKEKVLADRFSGIPNVSVGELVDFTFDDINIYDNLVVISGKPFISPFSDQALSTYRYYLDDSTVVDGRKQYLLRFFPKAKGDAAFSGFAWIEDADAAIQYAELSVDDRANLNFVNDFSVKQTFARMDNGRWFKTKESMFVALNLLKNKNKGSLRILKTSSRDKIKIDEPIDEEIFAGDPLERSPDAAQKDETYWKEMRHETLNNTEQQIYKTVDTLKSTRTYRTYEWLAYLGTTANFRFGVVELGRFYKFFSWNSIEGLRFRLGGRTTARLSKWFQILGYGAYGTRDQEWKYYASFRTHLPRVNERRHFLTLDYRYDFSQLSQEEVLLTHDNIATSIFRKPGQPLTRILKDRTASIMYERDWLRSIRQTFYLQHRTFYSIPGTFEFTNSEGGAPAPVDQFTTAEAKVKTQIGGQKFFETNFDRYQVTFDKPMLTLEYTLGIPGIFGSEFSYHKLEMELSQRLPSALGKTNYNLFWGKIFGDTPYPLKFIPKGNNSFLFNKFSYNLMNEFEFVMDEYAGFWAEHHFEGLLFNRVPLLKKLKLREVVQARVLAGRMNGSRSILDLPQENSGLPNSFTMYDLGKQGGLYAEVGVGIENIFKLFRVDVLWRLTQRDRADVSGWSIRVAMQPSF